MKHAHKSSGPFCMVRFLRNAATDERETYTAALATGDAVVFPAGSLLRRRAHRAFLPTWRIGRGRLTLWHMAAYVA